MGISTEPDRRFKIGELARETGLTVRTLHHYDAIGLLRASEWSDAGYRLYTSDDVRRLYEIVALRKLGFSLAAIGELLQEGWDPREAVRLQLEQVGGSSSWRSSCATGSPESSRRSTAPPSRRPTTSSTRSRRRR